MIEDLQNKGFDKEHDENMAQDEIDKYCKEVRENKHKSQTNNDFNLIVYQFQ